MDGIAFLIDIQGITKLASCQNIKKIPFLLVLMVTLASNSCPLEFVMHQLLYNALATFQRYMLSIFFYMVDYTMDDISMVGDSFQSCLVNLIKVLELCVEANLILNWQNCHFIIKEGIVLGHKISKKEI